MSVSRLAMRLESHICQLQGIFPKWRHVPALPFLYTPLQNILLPLATYCTNLLYKVTTSNYNILRVQ
jgi:hypothetical protein